MCVDRNIQKIEQKITAACLRAGRLRSDVCLVAVTKTLSGDIIQAGLDAGLRVFGENRVQEAVQHWHGRRLTYPDLQLHLIGGLQTNKVKEAVALFDVIETVDRPKLIDMLQKECSRQGRFPRFLVQVNVGDEDQKSGVAVADLPSLLDYAAQAGLVIDGLMAIPPHGVDPCPYFSLLHDLAMRHQLTSLSMGMSGDFEPAIAYGSTHIRIGTALFGER